MAAQQQPPKEWEALIQPYVKAIESSQGLCQIHEWIREDLPSETKHGGTIMKECQTLYEQILRPPAPTREHLEKPSKEQGQVQLPMPEPAARENIIVFEDSFGFTKAVLSNAPEGRIGTKKVVDRPWGQYGMDEVKQIIGTKGCSMILFGATCDIPKSNSVQDIIEFQTTVMKLAFYVVKCIIVNELPVKKLCFLSRGIFEEGRTLHEQAGLSLTTFATLFGFCNTARQELEETQVMLIDTEYFLKPPFWQTVDFRLVERLSSEVWRNETFGRNTVRILNKGRYVARQLLAQRYADSAETEIEMPEPGQIVAISGGNGSLGIIMAGWLVSQAEKQGKGGFEIQMLSRSCKIAADNMPPFQRVEQKAQALNITYVHRQCDLKSQDAADDFVRSTNGQLFGFIHSAGVLADCMIMNLEWDKFDVSWNPKHRAALYLHDAFERIPNCLSFFWMFSSVAVFGSMGQLNYASSNSVLDGIARHRRALGKPGQTMQWGGWGEVGMAANLDAANKRRMEMGPMPSFSNAQGLTGMEIGLRTNVPAFSVCQINPSAMFAMIYGDDSVMQSYNRNWYSEFVPPPPPSVVDPSHAYSLYRSTLFPYAWNPERDMLTWENYVAPLLDQENSGMYDEASSGYPTKLLSKQLPALNM